MKSEGDLCPPSDFDVLIETNLISHHGFFTNGIQSLIFSVSLRAFPPAPPAPPAPLNLFFRLTGVKYIEDVERSVSNWGPPRPPRSSVRCYGVKYIEVMKRSAFNRGAKTAFCRKQFFQHRQAISG